MDFFGMSKMSIYILTENSAPWTELYCKKKRRYRHHFVSSYANFHLDLYILVINLSFVFIPAIKSKVFCRTFNNKYGHVQK